MLSMLPKILGSILIMSMLAVGMIAGTNYVMKQAQLVEPVHIGLVIPEEQGMTKRLMGVLPYIESVKDICEFEYLEEDEAQERLKQGQLQAVIIFPDTFLEDVLTGINTAPRIILSEKYGEDTELFQELLADGVRYLATGEAAVYSVTTLSNRYPMVIERSKMEDLISYLYLDTVFGRGNLYHHVVLTSDGELELEPFYIVNLILIILLFSGLNLQYFFQRRDRSLEQKLKVYGIGCVTLALVKILCMTLLLWCLCMLMYAGILIGTKAVGLTYFQWGFEVPIHFLLLSFSCASFSGAVYALNRKNTQSNMILLLLDITMILLSGILIPLQLLPDGVQKLGALMPAKYWSDYLCHFVSGGSSVMQVVGIFLASIVLFGGVVFGLWKDA